MEGILIQTAMSLSIKVRFWDLKLSVKKIENGCRNRVLDVSHLGIWWQLTSAHPEKAGKTRDSWEPMTSHGNQARLGQKVQNGRWKAESRNPLKEQTGVMSYFEISCCFSRGQDVELCVSRQPNSCFKASFNSIIVPSYPWWVCSKTLRWCLEPDSVELYLYCMFPVS